MRARQATNGLSWRAGSSCCREVAGAVTLVSPDRLAVAERLTLPCTPAPATTASPRRTWPTGSGSAAAGAPADRPATRLGRATPGDSRRVARAGSHHPENRPLAPEPGPDLHAPFRQLTEQGRSAFRQLTKRCVRRPCHASTPRASPRLRGGPGTRTRGASESSSPGSGRPDPAPTGVPQGAPLNVSRAGHGLAALRTGDGLVRHAARPYAAPSVSDRLRIGPPGRSGPIKRRSADRCRAARTNRSDQPPAPPPPGPESACPACPSRSGLSVDLSGRQVDDDQEHDADRPPQAPALRRRVANGPGLRRRVRLRRRRTSPR